MIYLFATVCICMCACICICICVCICVCICICKFIGMFTCICICICMCIAYVHFYICIYTYTRTYTQGILCSLLHCSCICRATGAPSGQWFWRFKTPALSYQSKTRQQPASQRVHSQHKLEHEDQMNSAFPVSKALGPGGWSCSNFLSSAATCRHHLEAGPATPNTFRGVDALKRRP